MDLNIKNTPKRIKKKDAILDSALTIFSIYGYNNTKLEQITESLSLTDKSIYYYENQDFIEIDLMNPENIKNIDKLTKFLLHIVNTKSISLEKHLIILKHKF